MGKAGDEWISELTDRALVCDWSHGVPQVFYRFKDPRRVPPYMTCADVKLRVVYDIDQSLNVKDDVNE